MRVHVLRYRLLEILKGNLPHNTAQVCRLLHGAKSRIDVKFCRDVKYAIHRDPKGFTARGGNALYENCKKCKPGYGAVYRALMKLRDKGFVETRIEIRSDPIVPTQKDRMRMWAIRGRLPNLKKYL